jgi:hypothetical protein
MVKPFAGLELEPEKAKGWWGLIAHCVATVKSMLAVAVPAASLTS